MAKCTIVFWPLQIKGTWRINYHIFIIRKRLFNMIHSETLFKADIYRPPEKQDIFPFSRLPCSSLFTSQHVPFLHPLCACSLSCPSCLSHCHLGDVLPPLLFASKTIGPILQSELFANILSLASQVNAMLQSEPPLLSLKFMWPSKLRLSMCANQVLHWEERPHSLEFFFHPTCVIEKCVFIRTDSERPF